MFLFCLLITIFYTLCCITDDIVKHSNTEAMIEYIRNRIEDMSSLNMFLSEEDKNMLVKVIQVYYHLKTAFFAICFCYSVIVLCKVFI
jgi:hypothetical protein